MSLNGLDSPEVQAAYQAAVAEAAGWFLLQYVSRDGVELLARGRNGVSEARNAITAYTQASPLYGLIIYRRRRTLIKYIPEGTSRLLQARTSVHFQDILERYSPYETLLEITTGDALNDTALAKTFQLHTASPSPSVGRLDEITEDGEDAGAEGEKGDSVSISSTSLSAAQRYKAARRIDNVSRRAERGERSTRSPQPPSRRLTPPASPLKPAVSQFLVREDSGQTSITPLEPDVKIVSPQVESAADETAATMRTIDLFDMPSESPAGEQITTHESTERDPMEHAAQETEKPAPEITDNLPTPPAETPAREALQEEQPSMSEATSSIRGMSIDEDPYDLSKYDKYFKPKVKLGPRPVASADRAMRVARVSAVPASFKHARKQEPNRPQSQGQDSRPTSSATAAAVVQYEAPARLPPPVPVEYSPRPYSRGSVKSAPSHRSTGMTPDRLRLMKAVELRKRQLRKSQEQSSFVPPIEEDAPEMPQLPSRLASQPPTIVTTDNDQQPTETETEHSITDDESQPQSSKADSGIEIRYDTPSYDDLDERLPSPAEDVTPTMSLQEPDQLSATDEVLPPSITETETPEQHMFSSPTEDVISSTDAKRSLIEEQVSDISPAIPTIEVEDRSRPATSDGQAQAGADALSRRPSSDTLRSEATTTGTAKEASSRPGSPDLSKRRRGLVEPLHIEVSSGNPDDFMSDDDFLEELQSATVEEARPIIVARSPLSGSLPKHQPSMEDMSAVRSVSITRSSPSIPVSKVPSESDRLSPETTTALLGTSPTEKADSAWNPPRKVSSGISRRIQALNEMSTREAMAPVYNATARPLTPETSPNTFLHQDLKGRATRKAPSPAARPVSFRRLSKNNSATQTPVTTPSMENAPMWNIQHDPVTSRNSVSVTARIVRARADPDQDQDQLLPSELTINHQRDQANKSNLDLPPIDIAAAQQSNASSPALSPASRGSAEVRTLHSASTSRFGRRKKTPTTPATPEMDDFPPPPNQTMSPASLNDETVASKSGTRTSRFFKRVSTLSGPKRRSSAQSVVSTTSFVSYEGGQGSRTANRASVATHQSDTPPAVVVGDLNVQFPDSLLWKRRIVTINDSGHLQFAIAQAMEIHKGVALRNFPLHDFNAPYAPDLDRQELANSVVLELQDGTMLQLACEDSMTQRQVLHLLKSYWKAWADV